MGLIIDRWQACHERPVVSVILPDGCRDIIQVFAPGQPPVVFLSELDLSARRFQAKAGVAMAGVRLRPGVGVADCAMAEAVRQRPDDPDGAVAALLEAAQIDPDVEAVLAELAEGEANLTTVARNVGASLRQIQRRFAAKGLPPPGFWALLGRARRAALAMAGTDTLSEIAYGAGYADQPHMNRDFVRFFGASPAALRADPLLLAQAAQPGLAMGEQISIK